MKKIAIAANPNKKEALDLACELVDCIQSKSIEPILIGDLANLICKNELGADDTSIIGSDLLLILGGDGTLLHYSRLAVPHAIPMLGVNFGQYGFITEIQPENIIPSLEKVIIGDFYISERMVLLAEHVRDDQILKTFYALNDVVVSKGPVGRMLALHTYINKKFIVTYNSDGIILSSPTGSTAYSLSAGGPVVHPDVKVIILTPICPHTLTARPLAVPDSELIEIVGDCSETCDMLLTIDGQLGESLTCNDLIRIRKSEYSAKLVQLSPNSFYEKLQTRLRWGERFTK